jgi:(S)-2-hydroxyglutarate dehydrogenase
MQNDLMPYKSGIRAQVVLKNGEAVHDFMFAQTARMLNKQPPPSPAAYSSLPIREMSTQNVLVPV